MSEQHDSLTYMNSLYPMQYTHGFVMMFHFVLVILSVSHLFLHRTSVCRIGFWVHIVLFWNVTSLFLLPYLNNPGIHCIYTLIFYRIYYIGCAVNHLYHSWGMHYSNHHITGGSLENGFSKYEEWVNNHMLWHSIEYNYWSMPRFLRPLS